MTDEPRLLIIDPSAAIRSMLRAWFLRHGFAVDVAPGVASAVACFGGRGYNAICLEPEGAAEAVAGLQAQWHPWSALRALATVTMAFPDTPLVVFTSRSGVSLTFWAARVAALLRKPQSLETVEKAVRAAMRDTPQEHPRAPQWRPWAVLPL